MMEGEKMIERTLREVGLRKGQIVLDFGCGSGSYTLPVARIVGKEGLVYAIDKDEKALDRLMQRAETDGLKNIESMKTSDKLRIPLEKESVDVILLYDVMHDYYFNSFERKSLLKEVYRIARPNALLSVFPKHIRPEKIREEVEQAGFYLENKYSALMIHDKKLEKGLLLNFRK